MTDNSLLLALFIASMLLNVIDALLTRVALRRGYTERIPSMRKLIEKLGLDKALIVKLLVLVLIFLFSVIIGWYIPIIYLAAIILFIIVAVLFCCVVLYDCIMLLKAKNNIA
jgi:hypothetical protein